MRRSISCDPCGPGFARAIRYCTLYYYAMLGMLLVSTLPALADSDLIWQKSSCGNSPPPFDEGALLYDQARQRIVLFRAYFDTVYDCTLTGHWTWHASASYPPPRRGFNVVYDSARQRFVLFGGNSANRIIYNDTWEWDGNQWQALTPAHAPDPRSCPAMAYDSKRQRTLLYGGYYYNALGSNQTTYFNDMWEWDGSDWKKLAPTQSPTLQQFPSMTYDPERDRVVLYCGIGANGALVGETWEWDGSNWNKSNPTQSPSPPRLSGTIYDSTRKRVLLYGGRDFPGTTIYKDIWEWDGTTWTQMPTASTPDFDGGDITYADGLNQMLLYGGSKVFVDERQSVNDWWAWDGRDWTQTWLGDAPLGRDQFAMAYDSDRRRIVLFGGRRFNAHSLQDTWEWDGHRWLRRTPAQSPPARAEHAMVYDSTRKQVILFGGHPERQDLRLNDMWAWDGINWTELKPAQSPPGQVHPAMAYDRDRQRIVLNNGNEYDYYFPAETWEWDGINWSKCTPTLQPRKGGYMAYDQARKRLMLLCTDPFAMYTWNGVNWTRLTVSPLPPQRADTAIGFQESSGEIVMFGGLSHVTYTEVNDLWRWDGAHWTQLTPPLAPRPIKDHGLCFDGVSARYLLFGGSGDNVIYRQETWLLARPAGSQGWRPYP